MKVEIISDRMSCVTLRGHWCDILLLHMHVPTEDESDGTMDNFHDELYCAFNQFL
jgi:hypothetical protein